MDINSVIVNNQNEENKDDDEVSLASVSSSDKEFIVYQCQLLKRSLKKNYKFYNENVPKIKSLKDDISTNTNTNKHNKFNNTNNNKEKLFVKGVHLKNTYLSNKNENAKKLISFANNLKTISEKVNYLTRNQTKDKDIAMTKIYKNKYDQPVLNLKSGYDKRNWSLLKDKINVIYNS